MIFMIRRAAESEGGFPLRTKPKRNNAERQKGGIRMTDEEKKLLQAKHRLEEAQARDRVKERKDRTRRLIQEGAIMEKVFPWASDITDLSELEAKLYDISKRTIDC